MTESDGELLRRFAAARDEEAFEALVSRHGVMVWNVCRRILAHEQDAEDACQAAFGESARLQPEAPVDALTPRELEIMRLIGKGYSNPEIASELVVTINTIKKHTSNIYGKLGVRSRTQAIARAHELDLL